MPLNVIIRYNKPLRVGIYNTFEFNLFDIFHIIEKFLISVISCDTCTTLSCLFLCSEKQNLNKYTFLSKVWYGTI